MKSHNALAASLALAALACAPHRIPGTDVRDTKDNRAVYDVVQAYRQALERRDANAVLALVAPDYHDAAGTPDPSDDLDRATLAQKLPQDLERANGLKVDFTIRRIEVEGDRAQVELFYDQYYRVKTPTGEVPRRDSDIERLRLERVNGAWMIASGL